MNSTRSESCWPYNSRVILVDGQSWREGVAKIPKPALCTIRANSGKLSDGVVVTKHDAINILLLMRLDQIQVSSGAFNDQSVCIGFVIRAAKQAMVHEPQVHAPAGGLIER